MAGSTRDQQRQEKLAGLVLIAAAAVALLLANSGFSGGYRSVVGAKICGLSVHHWIADGLMAIFFLLVGLEVKREWLVGRLSSAAERRLPIVAAAAGMVVPAIVYLAVTKFDPALIRGWAIPAATDIAFAIGVIALLGSRANPAIKLLLVTIAVVDDVGAVLIIAFAYSSELNGVAIAAAALIFIAMAALNRFGVRSLWPYLVGFAFLWAAMLMSGIHATVAGVLAALTIPLATGERRSPLKRLEHAIHPLVMFGIVPLFGFVSAGVEVNGLDLFSPLPIAVAAGLFIGKQLGVFGAIWIAVRTGLAPRPGRARWSELYGASILCGIGFTMSLFIGALAFPASPAEVEAAKVGTLAGSLLSAILGFMVLRAAAPGPIDDEDRSQAGELFAANEIEDEVG